MSTITISIWQLVFGVYATGALVATLMISVSALIPKSTIRDDLKGDAPLVTAFALVAIAMLWFVAMPLLLWGLINTPVNPSQE